MRRLQEEVGNTSSSYFYRYFSYSTVVNPPASSLVPQCIRLIDETSLSRLVMPMMELIRAGGGTGASAGGSGSSAGGGTRGTGATSTAAIATATCIFLSHLALSSSTLISQPLPPCKLIFPLFFYFRSTVVRTLIPLFPSFSKRR